jgi:hypothetical protein
MGTLLNLAQKPYSHVTSKHKILYYFLEITLSHYILQVVKEQKNIILLLSTFGNAIVTKYFHSPL